MGKSMPNFVLQKAVNAVRIPWIANIGDFFMGWDSFLMGDFCIFMCFIVSFGVGFFTDSGNYSDLDYGDQHIISDCDTFVSPVITALANGNTLHRPDTVYWYKIQNIAQNVSSITQLAFPVSTSSSVPIYYRHRQNSVWGTWSRFIIDSDFGKSLRPETLNNIVNFGDYIQPVVAEATIDRNYPTTKAGLLEVRPFGDSWIYQRYTTHDGVTYNRRRYMGTWNAWVSK